MKTYKVSYSIQYDGLTIDGERDNVEATSQEDACASVEDSVLRNLSVFSQAEEEEEGDE